MYETIEQCRICGNNNLVEVLDLGFHVLTGIFPEPGTEVDTAPLVLVKCHDEQNPDSCCGLVQLKHTYELSVMYGEHYGYQSSLNPSMIKHLQNKIADVTALGIDLQPDDLIIDIGSNDGTSLNTYPEDLATLVGVDPTAKNFKANYKPHINLIEDFFSADLVKAKYPNKKAKIITSFSMYYDLEDPQSFTNEIADLLDDEGVWVLEQSYLPLMMERNSFDTICHEHLEYYSLRQIQWMFDRAGLKILDVSFNDINGGSFSINAAKKSSSHPVNEAQINQVIQQELEQGIHTLKPYQAFEQRINGLKQVIRDKITHLKQEGKTVYGIGASTKGNVILQYYGIDHTFLDMIGDVNDDKHGKVTPGTAIPIVSEEEVLAKKPDYVLIIPWHYRKFFEQSPKFTDTKLLFPLPAVEVSG